MPKDAPALASLILAPYRTGGYRVLLPLFFVCLIAPALLNADNGPSTRPKALYDVAGPERKNGIETWTVTSDSQQKPCKLYVLLPDRFHKLRHPDVFGRAGSWDGILMMDNRPAFYGSAAHFAGYSLANLLRQRAADFKNQPARIAVTGFGDLKATNDDVHALMTKLQIPHYFDNTIHRRHEWTSGWLTPLVEVLMADDMCKPIKAK